MSARVYARRWMRRPPDREPAGKAGTFLLVLVLGVVCGVGWAVYDYRQGGGNVDKLWDKTRNSVRDAYEEAAADRQRREAGQKSVSKTPPAPVPQPTNVAVQPPAKSTPAAATAPPSPRVDLYPAADVAYALRTAEARIKEGRFAEAREVLNGYEPGRVSEERRTEFQSLRDRGALLVDLLRETNITPSLDIPKLVSIEFKTGRVPFEGTILAQDEKKIEFRVLSGIAATFNRYEVLQIHPMDPPKAKRRIEAEFERRWKQVRDSKPMDAIRLGEFCLRNGLLERVAECFDRAARRDTNIVATVREEKANGLYDTFFFFLSIGNIREARSALALLRLRYPDSPLIEQAAQMEKETRDLAAAQLRSDIKPKEVKLVAAAAPAAGSTGPPQGPSAPAAREPESELPQDIPVSSAPASVPGLSDAKAGEFRTLVESAHAAYAEAVEHLKRSDPSENPESWHAENNKALTLLDKAYQVYNQALDIHNDPSLWDRIRDTNFKRVLAQRRKLIK